MRSVERRFNIIQDRNPFLGPYICLVRAVRGQRFVRKTISKWFTILISEEEYGEGERQPIFDHLLKVTIPEEVQNWRKIGREGMKEVRSGKKYRVGISRDIESKLEAKLTLHSYEN